MSTQGSGDGGGWAAPGTPSTPDDAPRTDWGAPAGWGTPPPPAGAPAQLPPPPPPPSTPTSAPTQPVPPPRGWQTAGPGPVSWQPGAGQAAGPSAWGKPQQAGWGAPPATGPAGAPRWRAVDVKPGIIPLRPLGLSDLYDGAFQAMRRNPRTMIGASAVVFVVIGIVQAVVLSLSTGSLANLFADPTAQIDDAVALEAVGSLGLASVITEVVSLFGTALLTGILTFAVGRAVLGEKLGPARLWTMVRPRLLAIIGLQLLFGLAIVVVFVVLLLPGGGLFFVSEPVGIVVGVLGALLAGLLALFSLIPSSMAAPALLLEELSVWRAFRRGWQILRLSFWRVLGILLLTGILYFVLVGVLSAPASFGGVVVSAVYPDDPRALVGVHPIQLVLSSLFGAIASTIVTPFLASVATLLYIDVRMRREGLDVELASAAAR